MHSLEGILECYLCSWVIFGGLTKYNGHNLESILICFNKNDNELWNRPLSPQAKQRWMSLLSVQTILIAILGSRAWKFIPSRVLTKSVEVLQFNLHNPSFTGFYQNQQGDFCCYKLNCAYHLQLSFIKGHSISDLFPYKKSSFCPALRITQIPCRVCDILNDGIKYTFSKFTCSRNLEGLVDIPVLLSFIMVFQRDLNRLEKQQSRASWISAKETDKSWPEEK